MTGQLVRVFQASSGIVTPLVWCLLTHNISVLEVIVNGAPSFPAVVKELQEGTEMGGVGYVYRPADMLGVCGLYSERRISV
jgi:hypothetical protein